MMQNKYYEIVRLCLRAKNDKDNEPKQEITFNLSQKSYDKSKTTLNESELIRILVHLNKVTADNNNNPELIYKADKHGCTFIDDMITLKLMDDEAIRKYKNQKDGILTLNILTPPDDNGEVKTIKTITYRRCVCGAGNSRGCKVYFIKESLFDTVNEILLCGLPPDMPFEVPAKFNAYYSLPATDSSPVSTPNIVVINDYVRVVKEKYDNVTKQDKEWVVQPDIEYEFPIMPFDGAGLVSIEMAKQWASELWEKDELGNYKLGLDYIPASFQIRAIAGIKGNLYTFDIKEFARRFNSSKIIDAWGKEWDIVNDEIDCILTKSQFKFFKKGLSGGYGSYQEWKDKFDNTCHNYRYTFNISARSNKFEDLKHETMTSYQPLQTLNFTDGEIDALCNDTVTNIKKIHTSLDAFLNYRGLYEDSWVDKKGRLRKASPCPSFYKALINNNALVNDHFIQQCIKDDIKRYKHKSYIGKLSIQGNFQIYTPDIFALAQFAFGHKVVGLLPPNTIYSNYWSKKNINEVDIIRYPHISQEHCVVEVANSTAPYYDAMKVWYKYQETGIISSMYDSLAQRLGTADFDGDQVCSTSNKVLINAAKRVKTNTIISVTEESSKPVKKPRKRKATKVPCINDPTELIIADARGMSCNIGAVVDKITTLWQDARGGDAEAIQKNIKIMSIIGGLTIDFAKTGKKERIPQTINNYVKQRKKPYFLQYKDRDDLASEREIEKNGKLLNMTDEEIQLDKNYIDSDCTMNRICHYMENQVDNLDLEFVSEDKFQFETLVLDINRNRRNETYKKVKQCLLDLHTDFLDISKSLKLDRTNDDYDYYCKYKSFYLHCRWSLLQMAYEGKFGGEENTVNVLLDYLIMLCYNDKDIKDGWNGCKYILWNAFEDEIVKRCKGDFKAKEYNLESLQHRQSIEKKKVKKAIQDKSNVLKFPSHDSFVISQGEIDYIMHQLEAYKSRYVVKILFTCLAICRMKKAECFELVYNSKLPDEINRCKIMKIAGLSRIDQINKSLGILQDKGFITLEKDEKKKGSVIICLNDGVCDDNLSMDSVEIADINIDLPKMLGKLLCAKH